MLKILLPALLLYSSSSVFSKEIEPYITAKLSGQTGNLCFQIAAISALAWDNGAQAYFPDLKYYPLDVENIFFRCSTTPPRSTITGIALETFPLPFKNGLRLHGFFQSAKYFEHHRQRILDLFAPKEEDLAYIKAKYSWILEHPNAVGVQLRYYKKEVLEGYPQYGIDYLEKAMSYFPEDTFFIISSDDISFAKQNVPSWVHNLYFLENESPYIDLFILSLCKHNIISNSTFGWWAAWLNQNPDKIVLHPSYWTDAAKDYLFPVCPEDWIAIDANFED